MTEGELERWESVIPTLGTMEAIRQIQRRSELDKEGTLIKEAKSEKQESSNDERKRGKKMSGGGTQNKRHYAPTGSERIRS